MRKTLCLLIVLCCLTATTSSAGVLDPREIALATQSSLVDFDLGMIGLNYGNPATELAYVSYITESGWQGRLFGMHGSHQVDIYYTGNLTYVGGDTNAYDISYSSAWYLDGLTGTGSGQGNYWDPSFIFGISMTGGVFGEASVTYAGATITLRGEKNPSTSMLTVSGSLAVLNTSIGSAASGTVAFNYNQTTGAYTSTLNVKLVEGLLLNRTWVLNAGTIVRPVIPPPAPVPPPPAPRPQQPPTIPYTPVPYNPGFGDPDYPGYNDSSMACVPEPGSLVALGGGLIGLAGMIVRRRR